MLAPLVWLASTDGYFPSDISAHLTHVKPQVDFKPVDGAPSPLDLNNLNQLNDKGGTSVYLTSVEDVSKNPSWLAGVKPDASGKINGATPCTVIVSGA